MITIRESDLFRATGNRDMQYAVYSDSMLLGLVSSEQLFELGLSPADLTNSVCR